MPDSLERPRLVARPRRRAETAGRRVSDSEEKFRDLALGALDNEQVERAKLARILHDEVAQILSSAGLQLDILRMDLADTSPGIASRTAEIQELLDLVVRQIRDLSYRLNPDVVTRAGLQPALDLLVGRFRKSFQGNLRLNYDLTARLSIDAAIAMERIAEEAVDNAIRHGACRRIEIIVKAARKGATLQVRDDGPGFDYELARKSPRGLGLPMMEYWASKAGLRLAVSSSPGQGAAITATVLQRNLDES